MRLHIRPFFLICVIKHAFFSWIVCKYPKSAYLCNVFFIVLDLRLTKVGVQRYSFFYALMLRMYRMVLKKSEDNKYYPRSSKFIQNNLLPNHYFLFLRSMYLFIASR